MRRCDPLVPPAADLSLLVAGHYLGPAVQGGVVVLCAGRNNLVCSRKKPQSSLSHPLFLPPPIPFPPSTLSFPHTILSTFPSPPSTLSFPHTILSTFPSPPPPFPSLTPSSPPPLPTRLSAPTHRAADLRLASVEECSAPSSSSERTQ